MRIISPFNDYYDCVQAKGQDQTCVWVRKPETYTCQWFFTSIGPFNTYFNTFPHFTNYMIGFCGKVYPVTRISIKDKSVLCHSFEDMDSFIQDNMEGKDLDFYMGKRIKNSRCLIKRKDVRQFYTKCKERESSYEEVFYKNGCPVFVAVMEKYKYQCAFTFHGRNKNDESGLPNGKPAKYNSRYPLRDFEFYRVFPTDVAFQEIYMYISGVLGFNNPHVPVPDDKTMRDIKGFDKKSFKHR